MAPLDWDQPDQALWVRVVTQVQAGLATASQEHMPWREPLKQHLLAHAASDEPAVAVLAECLATASMGPHHPWQDLGLSGRSLGLADLKPPKCSLCDQFEDCMGTPAPAFQGVA